MQIFIKNILALPTITLNVESWETIYSVKRRLEDKKEIGNDVVQMLMYEGKHLDDSRTLAHYNILKDSTLHLLLLREKLPLIYVKTSTGKVITLGIEGLNTIGDVKAKIYEQEGIAPDLQFLVSNGRQLDGNQTLLENRIGKESTLHLFLRLRDIIMNGEGPQTQVSVTTQCLHKRPAPQVGVAPPQSKRARPATKATPNSNMQGLATCADPQAMSHNTYEAMLNVFALHQAKATAALSDLMPEFRARPPPSVLTELEDVKREMANARSKEKEQEATIFGLTQKNKVFSDQCASYESQIVTLKAENKKIKEELTVAGNKEKELEATVSGLTHKNRMFSDQCASYESQIVILKAENNKTEKELTVASIKEKKLEATITRLTHKNKTYSAQCASYESQIVALEIDGKKTKEILMVAHSKEKELKATISIMEAENKKSEEEVTVARNKEKELETTIARLTHKNKNFSSQFASYESQIVALEADCKKTKEALIITHRKEKELEATISRIEAENKKSEEEVTVARNKEKELEATISRLTHKNKTFSSQFASYESQIAALEADCKKTKQVVIIAHSKEKELEATITRLTHKYKVFCAQCASYESQVAALEADCKKTKQELMVADKKYSRARAAGYAEGLKEGKAKRLKSVEFLHHLTDASMQYFDYGFDSCQKQAEHQGFVGKLNKNSALKEAPKIKGWELLPN